MTYQKLNNITGWIVFAIATATYLLTIEPTVSFWDCGEFIASAYKLEVGHPPGAPFFMMIGRFFSFLFPKEEAAKMINVMSALSSSFTILFLFWSITYLAKKIIGKGAELLSSAETIAILGSGAVGALAYTFSDTFWFSAVEGEVYAMSSLFTAVVFWAILKWEAVSDQPYANRWIVLIAYLVGLSIGVHLLNLLAIPAIVLVYYFKKYPVSPKGLMLAALASLAILGFVQSIIIPGTVKLAAGFELTFVNGFGMPFDSGTLIYLLMLSSVLVLGLAYVYQNKQSYFNGMLGILALIILLGTVYSYLWSVVGIAVSLGGIYFIHQMGGKKALHLALTSVTVILIGYSTYALIFIRSNANPPMDENNPENVFSLLSYLNREQYGDRPLLYGQYFNSPLDVETPYKDGDPVYFQDKASGKYIVSDDKKSSKPNYAKEFCSIFPRMYSPEQRHIEKYKYWSDFKGKKKSYRNIRTGETESIPMPTFGENLKFLWSYQIDWMYLRYFMWNFAGRQNDVQGHGGPLDGNWISGIDFIDSARLGIETANLPETMSSNKALNKFYFLPLILGILGIFIQVERNGKDALVVALLFALTGLAIVIYLNQYPYQPRERDYAYAGSFYAFSIWIGLGVLYLFEKLRGYMGQTPTALASTLVCLLAVPTLMAKEGWDDHDRSNTFTARDFAKNYLNSCEKNAILFTNGDNDTFPLWYVQEVEEYRTDVRVCNLSLLNTDWYIDQMRRKAYDSDGIPAGLEEFQYRQGTRDYLQIIPMLSTAIDVKELMAFVEKPIEEQAKYIQDKRIAQQIIERKQYFIPGKLVSLKVDSAKVLQNGTLDPRLADRMVNDIIWDLNKSYIFKNDMMILDLLANNNWDRPVYFAITTGSSAYIGLDDYFQIEGLTYRLVPMKTPENRNRETGYVHTDKMYNNLMNKFVWGGLDTFDIYMNENNRRMCMNLRNNFSRLADALIEEGKKDKALEVLNRCIQVMPEKNVPYDYFMIPVVRSLYAAGDSTQANALSKRMYGLFSEELAFMLSLDRQGMASIKQQIAQNYNLVRQVLYVVSSSNQKGMIDELSGEFTKLEGDMKRYRQFFPEMANQVQ
jgi:hypothetical protein